MKKIFYICVALFFAMGTVLADNTETVVLEKESGLKGGRSLVTLPVVTINKQVLRVDVTLFATGSSTIEITDADGGVVYQAALITDGSLHSYFLPQLPAGNYTIRLISPSSSYVGRFSI